MRLPQREALLGGVGDGLQRSWLIGEVSWRGAGRRGVLQEVNTMEFPPSSSTTSPGFTCDVQWDAVCGGPSSRQPAWFLCDGRSDGG